LTSSIAAHRPRPGIAAYVASKGGAAALARALALELAPDRIRVNVIAPVAVRTPMLGQFAFGPDVEATIERVEQTIPLGRLTEPEDVANAAVYLASDEARCITGITLNVDGGRDL
jgi:3-oxoacyl-[acyl-carrier protein] reductase